MYYRMDVQYGEPSEYPEGAEPTELTGQRPFKTESTTLTYNIHACRREHVLCEEEMEVGGNTFTRSLVVSSKPSHDSSKSKTRCIVTPPNEVYIYNYSTID